MVRGRHDQSPPLDDVSFGARWATVRFTQSFLDALVPGAVREISVERAPIIGG